MISFFSTRIRYRSRGRALIFAIWSDLLRTLHRTSVIRERGQTIRECPSYISVALHCISSRMSSVRWDWAWITASYSFLPRESRALLTADAWQLINGIWQLSQSRFCAEYLHTTNTIPRNVNNSVLSCTDKMERIYPLGAIIKYEIHYAFLVILHHVIRVWIIAKCKVLVINIFRSIVADTIDRDF